MNIRVDKAALDDLNEILELQQKSYQSEAELYNDFTIQPLTETLEQVVDEFRRGVFLKVEIDGKIIGSVRAYESDGTAYINKLIVHPDYQNKGVGKKLLQAIEEAYPDRRYELFTGAKSEKNLSVYSKAGYVQFKEEQATPELTFVYMEKQNIVYFENTFEMTRPLFNKMTKTSPKKIGKTNFWFLRYIEIIGVLFLLLCIGYACLLFILKSILGVIPLGLAAFVGLFIYYFIKSDVSKAIFDEHKKRTGESTWIFTAKFSDKIYTKGRQTLTTAYEDIYYIEEDDEVISLWSDAVIIFLRKAFFTIGTAEDFLTFIKQKCNEKKPLLTLNQAEKRFRKPRIPYMAIVIVITLGFFAYFATVVTTSWFAFLTSSESTADDPLTRAIERQWEDDVSVIATVEVDGGVAVFGTNGKDTLYTMLLSVSRSGNYNYAKGYSESITLWIEYNEYYNVLQESSAEWFAFSHAPTIVFGIAKADWWDTNTWITSSKEKYTAERFTNENVDFILYYRYY